MAELPAAWGRIGGEDQSCPAKRREKMGFAAGLCLILPLITSACTGRFSTPQPSPTAPPLPASSTPEEAILPSPATSPAPSETPGSSTPTPSASPASTATPPSGSAVPTEELIPQVEIRIMAPGPLSRIVTSLHLSSVLVPGAAGKVHAELLGEDGRLLASTTEQFANRSGTRINFLTDLDFEIEAVAETGTLTVSVADRFGRTTDLASVEVILLAEGQTEINPPGDLLAPIVVLEPAAGGLASGGELLVTGLARPGSEGPLLLELITQDGTVVGSRLAAVDPGPPGEHRPFLAIIPYTVSEPTQALLVVKERSDRFSGATQILSQDIVLSP